MENPVKMDDSGVPLFSETSMYLVGFGWLGLVFSGWWQLTKVFFLNTDPWGPF